MKPSYVTTTVEGKTSYEFNFDYTDKRFVKVTLGAIQLTYGEDYTVVERHIVLSRNPGAGRTINIYRETQALPFLDTESEDFTLAILTAMNGVKVVRLRTTITNRQIRTYNFGFDYIKKQFIKVEIDGTKLVYGRDYRVEGKSVVLTTEYEKGTHITIYRQTDTTPLVSWSDSSIMRASDCNLQFRQYLHLIEELAYSVSLSNTLLKFNIHTAEDLARKEVELTEKTNRLIKLEEAYIERITRWSPVTKHTSDALTDSEETSTADKPINNGDSSENSGSNSGTSTNNSTAVTSTDRPIVRPPRPNTASTLVSGSSSNAIGE